MLRSRRLLAFSSRVHTYTLMLYTFFFIVYVLSGYFSVEPAFVDLLRHALSVVSLAGMLFGFWVLLHAVIVFSKDGIFPGVEASLTVIRIAAFYAMNLFVTLMETLFANGLAIR
jgi:hypothetical protein